MVPVGSAPKETQQKSAKQCAKLMFASRRYVLVVLIVEFLLSLCSWLRWREHARARLNGPNSVPPAQSAHAPGDARSSRHHATKQHEIITRTPPTNELDSYTPYFWVQISTVPCEWSADKSPTWRGVYAPRAGKCKLGIGCARILDSINKVLMPRGKWDVICRQYCQVCIEICIWR